MIKALLLILAPIRTWTGIARARRNVLFVLFLFLVPWLALSILGELYGHNYLVTHRPEGEAKPVSDELMIRYGGVQFVAGLIVVFLCAGIIKILSDTFHNRHTYTQCFAVAAYALSPLLLFHLADAIPGLNPWITFAVGMIFSISTLYHAIPLVLKPDPPHAFGLFLMSTILLVMVSGLARAFTWMVLQERIKLPF
jgi:Yip1 domain